MAPKWLKQGRVIYCWVEDISKPANKFAILLGLDLERDNLLAVLINSAGGDGVPPKWDAERFIDFQIKLDVGDYHFIEHPSYINCHEFVQIPYSKILNGQNGYFEDCCTLKREHLDLVLAKVHKSQNLTQRQSMTINTPTSIDS
jgi:hypothetical protein